MYNNRPFFGEYNPTKIIYEGEISLQNDNITIILEGKIISEFFYKYNLKIIGEITETNNRSLDYLGQYKVFAGELIGSCYINQSRDNLLSGNISKEITTNDTKLNKLNIPIVNLVDIGNDIVEKENQLYRGASFFEYKDWNIKIIKNNEFRSIYEDLKRYNGYAITHTCSITSKNKYFTFNESKFVMNQMFSYLSFISGRRIYPYEIIGFKNGEKAFTKYQQKIIDPWKSCNTWFPVGLREPYPNLFKNFTYLWENEPWKNYRNIILGTYYEAFAPVTLENKITSVLITLEIISRIYLTQITKSVSNRQFRNNSNYNRLKTLFESLDIPLTKPQEFLIEKTNNQQDDPLRYFINTRNSIVHPKQNTDLNFTRLHTSYYLGLWLLEIAILKILKHDDRYRNRLSSNKWMGISENGGSYYFVPWIE